MKYHKISYVIDALNEAIFPNILIKECQNEKLINDDGYAWLDNKIYSNDEVIGLSDEDKLIIVERGRYISEDWLISAVKSYVIDHQEIIENSTNLDKEQKELLRTILKNDMFFIPIQFTNLDGIYTVDKIDIVLALLNTVWKFDCCYAESYENIYILSINFNEYQKRRDIVNGFNEKEEVFKELDIYIPYKTFFHIYRTVFNSPKTDFWKWSIKEADFERSTCIN